MLHLKGLSWGAVLAATCLVLGCSSGEQGIQGQPGQPGDAGPPGTGIDAASLENSVSGTVTTAAAAPLSGVSVTATPGTIAAVTTSATGAYTFPSLPIGAYELTFSLAGYDTQIVPVAVNLAGPTTVSAVVMVAEVEPVDSGADADAAPPRLTPAPRRSSW